MDTKKINVLSAIYINNIKHEYKFYAIKIMDHLYSQHKEGMSLKQIYDIFDGYPKEAIDNTLESLSDRLLIEQIHFSDPTNSPEELRFNLSEFGRYKLTQYYNSDYIYF